MTQERATELALQGHSLFLTGQAGTGKTYTLNSIIKTLTENGKRVTRTASTGIASTHINGTTIHSWAGVGIKSKLSADDLYKIKNNNFSFNRINNTDVLIIDEISMLPDYVFDLVNEVCSFIKDKKQFFGGIQLIVCGDFFQLPPVNRNGNGNLYCFNSGVWNSLNMKVCYLDHIYRQSDPEFIDLLNSIRTNSIEEKHINLLNSLKKNTKNIDKAVNLYPKNINVDIENTRELNKLNKESHIFRSNSDGVGFVIERIKKNMIVNDTIIIKEGAKVMLAANKYEKGIPLPIFVNGTLGTVQMIIKKDDIEEIIIKTSKTEEIISLKRHKWAEIEVDRLGKEKTVAKVEQFPLKLAWALTVHKSQGATLDYVNLDLTETFTHNMGYVALSRATSLEGIHLSGFNETALEIDPVIIAKDKEFQEKSKGIE